MTAIVVGVTGTPYRVSTKCKPDFDVLAVWQEDRFLVLGSEYGDLFDPLNSSHNFGECGGLFWRLSVCSRECFFNYTSFLRSKRRTPYIFAKRRFNRDF